MMRVLGRIALNIERQIVVLYNIFRADSAAGWKRLRKYNIHAKKARIDRPRKGLLAAYVNPGPGTGF